MSKNNIVKLIITLVLLTQSATVLAMDRNIYYVGVSIGRIFADVDNNSEHGALTEVVLGQYYNETDVAFEVAYTDLDKYDITKAVGTSSEQTSFDMSGLKLIAAKHFIFTPEMYMNIKGGVVYWREDTETITKDQAGTITNAITGEDKGFSVYLGLGYSYSLTKESRVNLTIERFDTENGEFTNALVGVIFSL